MFSPQPVPNCQADHEAKAERNPKHYANNFAGANSTTTCRSLAKRARVRCGSRGDHNCPDLTGDGHYTGIYLSWLISGARGNIR